MDNEIEGAKRARYVEIEKLYRSGLSMREVGERLEPPISAQRVGALLREGVALGLFPMPATHHARQAEALRVTQDGDVLAALLATRTVTEAARLLGFSRAVLQRQYGHCIRQARTERVRKRIIADYRTLAAKLGRNPVVSEDRILASRITKQFGSFAAFYESAAVVPDYRRQPRKPRKPRGKGK